MVLAAPGAPDLAPVAAGAGGDASPWSRRACWSAGSPTWSPTRSTDDPARQRAQADVKAPAEQRRGLRRPSSSASTASRIEPELQGTHQRAPSTSSAGGDPAAGRRGRGGAAWPTTFGRRIKPATSPPGRPSAADQPATCATTVAGRRRSASQIRTADLGGAASRNTWCTAPRCRPASARSSSTTSCR